MKTEIIHQEEANQFKLEKEGLTAFIEYHIQDKNMIFSRTFVPAQLEGLGIGTALVKHALDYALAHQLKIVPHCSFVRIYVERHTEYQ